MAIALYFVRHGQTDWNAERRVQGRLESDLTELGRAQVQANAEVLARLGVDAIVASPLRRTRQSAEIIARATGVVPRFDARLAEWDAGAWSRSIYSEIAMTWPDAWAAWRADPWRVRAPDGENFEDLVRRGRPALDEVIAAGPGRTALVGHGFMGRALLADLLDLPRAEAAWLHTGNDTFFRCRHQGEGWACDRFEAGGGPIPGVGLDSD